MKLRGSQIVVKALEDAGVRFTFGIPGTHNIELYDALEDSPAITPILVTDEQSASFMADAVSRTSSVIGVVNVVPGAGVTHCLSGIAEAFMDGVPLLVLTCGIRSDPGRAYQLHDIDQLALLRPITKGAFRPASADEIYSTVRRAVDLARCNTPGPVAVEIPANVYMLTQEKRQTLWALAPEHRRKVRECRRELAQRRQELFGLLKQESLPEWPPVQAKVREISALQGGLEEEMARFMLDFKKHLKPQQHDAFLSMVQQRLRMVTRDFHTARFLRAAPC